MTGSLPDALTSARPPSRRTLLSVAGCPELLLAFAFLAVAMALAWSFALPFVLPAGDALEFTGMSYGVPLSLIGLLGLYLVVTRQTERLVYYALTAVAYGMILIAHFNVKLWMSLVNPRLWDDFYWRTDQAVRPLVDAAFAVHRGAAAVLPFGDHLYLFAFLAMFAGSIIVHSNQSFIVFRKVLFASMLVHVLGALSYLVMPAVGPFLYEAGANALETARQQHMHGGYTALAAGGRPWLASEGDNFLFAAVAAMPSLHVASSAVFVFYAWKHARWLGAAYLPLFVFIIFEAVATRWHYWIDAAAGLALTALAIALTAALFHRIPPREPAGARYPFRRLSGAFGASGREA